MAVATGRGVLEVARESFALTLYTWWHLEQRRHLTAIAGKMERFDAAGLMAQAFHKPSSLPDGYHDFLAKLAPASDRVPESGGTLNARQLAVIRAAHAEPQGVTTLTVS